MLESPTRFYTAIYSSIDRCCKDAFRGSSQEHHPPALNIAPVSFATTTHLPDSYIASWRIRSTWSHDTSPCPARYRGSYLIEECLITGQNTRTNLSRWGLCERMRAMHGARKMDMNHSITAPLTADRTLIALCVCFLGRCSCTVCVEPSGCEYHPFTSVTELILTVDIANESPTEFREVVVESTSIIYFDD